MPPVKVAHPAGFPLQLPEYRSFIHTIELYHYPHTRNSIAKFEESLSAADHGFVRRLESSDTLCQPESSAEKNFVPDGDEVPEGFTEVAYLPKVFKKQNKRLGCALGFRLLDEDRIEWFCFDRTFDKLEETFAFACDDGTVLFDKVALLERGDPAIKWRGRSGVGYVEHRDWYNGLVDASMPLLSLEIVEESRFCFAEQLGGDGDQEMIDVDGEEVSDEDEQSSYEGEPGSPPPQTRKKIFKFAGVSSEPPSETPEASTQPAVFDPSIAFKNSMGATSIGDLQSVIDKYFDEHAKENAPPA